MTYFPQPSTGKVKFFAWGFLGLLDEGMQNQHFVANGRTEKRPANPFWPFGTNLKQSLSHGTGVGHAKMGAKRLHPFGDTDVPGAKTNRPSFNISPDGLAIIPDCPCHAGRLTIPLIICQSGLAPNARGEPRPKAEARNERKL
jgi:hypothetical protein